VALPSLYAKSIPDIKVSPCWGWRKEVDAMIDEASGSQKPGKWVLPADPFWQNIPVIAQYCSDFWWEKTGKPRTPCKLAIQCFGGSVQVSMNDEEKKRSCHTTAETIQEALGLLDEHLKAGTAPWRYWKR
jgi:hypothetical protein